MRIVTANEFQGWLEQGRPLEQDSRGVKVLCLSDGRYLKIFRSRHHPWWARCFPQARRFERNARQLNQKNIHTPEVLESIWIDPHQGVSACLYRPLAGESLEQLYRKNPEACQTLLPALAAYIKTLHQKGVYFRSLHLGNILLHQGSFGLIDFLDLRVKRRPLSPRLIQRNFAHLERYLLRRHLNHFPLDRLLALYQTQPNSSNG